MDKRLPFGLRSAPKLFNTVADALEWIIKQRGASFVFHYLDDFIMLGAPESDECSSNHTITLQACEEVNAPVAEEKTVGPTTSLPYLGIEIDTSRQELRLPLDKLVRLMSTIQKWRGRKTCTKCELLSLLGQLHHACKVVRPGRIFLSQMIRLSTTVTKMDHHLRLNQAFRSDLEWWHRFLAGWNGVSMLWQATGVSPGVTLTSDASGS